MLFVTIYVLLPYNRPDRTFRAEDSELHQTSLRRLIWPCQFVPKYIIIHSNTLFYEHLLAKHFDNSAYHQQTINVFICLFMIRQQR